MAVVRKTEFVTPEIKKMKKSESRHDRAEAKMPQILRLEGEIDELGRKCEESGALYTGRSAEGGGQDNQA